jgi:tRNA threonylcarbamoyladenosine biosynthesis protein TsaE
MRRLARVNRRIDRGCRRRLDSQKGPTLRGADDRAIDARPDVPHEPRAPGAVHGRAVDRTVQADLARKRGDDIHRVVMTAFDLPDEAATAALAARIAALAAPGDVVALTGDLGVGKTSFARAFIRARGDAEEEVPSPTFTLVQVYEAGGAAIWHFDLYRLSAAEEAWELGIEEAFTSGISLIEWPERLGSLLPQRRLEISLAFGERTQARQAVLTGGAEWRARLAEIAADA